ncbi:MAG TPA: UDP-N-acetylglucosamine 1-carboxyvinyltransferase [bacterium]|nr:UDP-N-acetylglucosamine 1-carboxyvinyltransferase [bacterium]
MPKFVITGGAKLSGTIAVKGAKNAGLKIIPAAILSQDKITIHNLPDIEDISRSFDILTDLGATVARDGDAYVVDTSSIKHTELKHSLANKLRASIMFVGPLLARFGEVKFPHPGGCVIGAGQRPIDLFLEGFAKMGAGISTVDNYYHLTADKLRGCEFFFTTVTVTGTESMMMTATLAEGKTVLSNCAMEPEIVALAEYLNSAGAKISGAGTPVITIEGVEKIGGGEFTTIADRIEAGTFAIMAAATNSELTISDCRPDHLESLLAMFTKIGVPYTSTATTLTILKHGVLKALDIKTHEYPGFPTDLQSPYTILMTQAEGMAIVHETIYDRRLLFTDMLTQMGANIIMCDPHRVVISGPTKLHGHKLTSPDLRAGIAMIIAGMIASGKTEIDNIYQIDRGYEKIDERLRTLGANIQRID